MSLDQGYDAKSFCKNAVSNWSPLEPELLKWTAETHNRMSILAVGVRKQSIAVIGASGFPETALNCIDAIPEIENAIAISISFIEFNELPGIEFPEASSLLVKEVQKKISAI